MASSKGVRAGDVLETRRIFLDALARLGTMKAAAAAAGVSPDSIYHARRTDPEFAAAWQAITGAPLRLRGMQVRGWSAERRQRFLECFAATGSMRRAIEAVKGSHTSVYRLCVTDSDFAAACHEARDQARNMLQDDLLDRALNGVERAVTVNGEQRIIVSHDNGLALRLIDRWAARTGKQPRGRFIELTPENVAIANRKVLALLTLHGAAAFRP
ncbi:hypothetical protein [Glacieibacterium sp.]|uniref:hypothetical protein n=1 Tax=Glacieibacterium sp. TaxID=2860237 RepID=UPI003B00D163